MARPLDQKTLDWLKFLAKGGKAYTHKVIKLETRRRYEAIIPGTYIMDGRPERSLSNREWIQEDKAGFMHITDKGVEALAKRWRL